jgi:hypothetical protein
MFREGQDFDATVNSNYVLSLPLLFLPAVGGVI